MLDISIRTVPHRTQRYDTCGDYITNSMGRTLYSISALNDWRMETCVAVHELIEHALCKHAGITEQEIDQFDMEYERNRRDDAFSEPGDDPKAPYHKQHRLATKIERIVAKALGVNWREYNKVINAL